MIEHILLCRKMMKLFRIFLNIHEFFNFFEVFRINFFCIVSNSHVVDTIRFAEKFHIGLLLSGRWGKSVLHQKLSEFRILRGLKLRKFTSNQINPHWKESQNHRTIKNSNTGFYQEETPTHISATYEITNI